MFIRKSQQVNYN